jgi:hypothetical protein
MGPHENSLRRILRDMRSAPLLSEQHAAQRHLQTSTMIIAVEHVLQELDELRIEREALLDQLVDLGGEVREPELHEVRQRREELERLKQALGDRTGALESVGPPIAGFGEPWRCTSRHFSTLPCVREHCSKVLCFRERNDNRAAR